MCLQLLVSGNVKKSPYNLLLVCLLVTVIPSVQFHFYEKVIFFFFLAQALECCIKAWFRKHPPACQVTAAMPTALGMNARPKAAKEWGWTSPHWEEWPWSTRVTAVTGVFFADTHSMSLWLPAQIWCECVYFHFPCICMCLSASRLRLQSQLQPRSFSFWEYDQPGLRYAKH